MSNEVMQVSLAVISLLGIIATGIFSYMARNAAKEVKKDVSKVVEKVDEYHKEVNGKMGLLLETTKQLGEEVGKAKEKENPTGPVKV